MLDIIFAFRSDADVEPFVFTDLQEGVDDARVEVCADVSSNLFARLDVRGRGAIRAVAGDRIEGVSDGEDARVDVNLLATQTHRVAVAIIFFVMLADDRGRAFQKIDPMNNP